MKNVLITTAETSVLIVKWEIIHQTQLKLFDETLPALSNQKLYCSPSTLDELMNKVNSVVLSPLTGRRMGRCPWPALSPPRTCPPSDLAKFELLTLWTRPSLGDSDSQVKVHR